MSRPDTFLDCFSATKKLSYVTLTGSKYLEMNMSALFVEFGKQFRHASVMLK
jgi:hypothetical protein